MKTQKEKKWQYGGAIDRYPIEAGQVWSLPNGSALCVADITEKTPELLRKADLLFIDPPWNIGNLNCFITKADRDDYRKCFNGFLASLFSCIWDIAPQTCYMEMGKQHLADAITMMRRIFPKVTFYNSSYYHKKNNICYIVRGSQKSRKNQYDFLDEEIIIEQVCKDEEYNVIGDLCMGRGLVGLNAYANGKTFVGCDINPKRLAVLIEKLANQGETWITK